ncbi:MAG: helix-turn-helix domain-containing protein, partial [Chloroflexi bacterium]|nr:helix-turn-helix domain-containing protein [Chloroflexota bacterium]
MTELMTLEEVASYLRVTEKTVYRLVDRRAIPAAKVGHQWR